MLSFGPQTDTSEEGVGRRQEALAPSVPLPQKLNEIGASLWSSNPFVPVRGRDGTPSGKLYARSPFIGALPAASLGLSRD